MSGLSAGDRQRVEAAVRGAERRTSAEFAVVVAQASDPYSAFPLFWAAILMFLAGGIIALARPTMSAAWLYALMAAVFVVSSLVLHVGHLRYWFVPSATRREHAARLARLQFAALVQDRTRGDLGVLLFVSLAERYIEILVDRGIAERIDKAVWRNAVDDLVPALQSHRLADGLVTTIGRCTDMLEKHFPIGPGDHNEIPDKVTEV